MEAPPSQKLGGTRKEGHNLGTGEHQKNSTRLPRLMSEGELRFAEKASL